MYHSISSPLLKHESGFVCEPKVFDEHMKLLKKKGYYFASINEVYQHLLNQKKLPENSVLISFDDGYMDNYINAFPILLKYKIPAVIFLVAGLIGKKNNWFSGKQWTTRELLTLDRINEMTQGEIDFECHSLNHKKLTSLDDNKQKEEIIESKKILEDRLNKNISYIAYPHGLYNQNTLDIVRDAGYLMGFSTHSGFNSENIDPFVIRRLEVNGLDSAKKLLYKVQFGMNDPTWNTKYKYYYKQLIRRINGH